MILLISCSLNPESRSRLLARAAHSRLVEGDEPVEFVDLQNVPLPLCDGGATYGDANARRLSELGSQADAILLAAPVYNYSASAAAKNLVELTGRSWTGKVVGLLFAAGGQSSYMSGLSLANSLMLDFRCLVLPRYLYAEGGDFADGVIASQEVNRRLAELVDEVVRVSRALRDAPAAEPRIGE